jgi:adenosyl cobinamide kinase/adenosyl cobinamide phosphate guanylyltransferase
MAPAVRRTLVLGGIRSGKSEYAEELAALRVTATRVTYVATARPDPADRAFAARLDRHRARRPADWGLAEVGDGPDTLPALLAGAGPEETLLVDDVGGWVAALLAGPDAAAPRPAEGFDPGERLAAAVRASHARVILVSPEVGLSVVPATAAGMAFADALGATNRAVAAACEAVVLVIAGNAVPVKGALAGPGAGTLAPCSPRPNP